MTDDDTVEVSDAVLAKILRCDRMTISRYTRNGIVTREKNRKIRLVRAIGDVVEHLRAVAGRIGQADTQRAGAALKDAQRRLTETKLAKLEGELISRIEIEAIWGDLVASAKWLFLALPSRARIASIVVPEKERELTELCADMLREIVLNGERPIQLPGDRIDDDDDEPASPEAPSAR